MEDGHYLDRDGDEVWVSGGCYHRMDGPAIIYADGYKEWIQFGRLHRTDGPAFITQDGICEWRILGAMYTFDKWLKVNNQITEEEKVMLKLKYG